MSEEWLNDAPEFDFFAFVRLCERMAYETHRTRSTKRFQPLGVDTPPSRESTRFRVDPTLGFPASSISQASRTVPDDDAPSSPVEVLVTFMGMIGSSGVLSENYGAIVLQRLRLHDHVLKDFLDLFHHRLLSQFYRAWCKQHLAAHVERAHLSGEEELFSTVLYSLAGYGPASLRNRTQNPDDVLLQYSGHFSRRPRTATALRQILTDYFDLPVAVQQFQGRWLQIEDHDRTILPDLSGRNAQCQILGTTAILGERLWDVQTMIRLTIGPLDADRFDSLLPSEPMLLQLAQLTRAFLGPELDFDIQLVLPNDQVRTFQLGVEASNQHLGWNCWLGVPGQTALVDDAVFSLSNC